MRNENNKFILCDIRARQRARPLFEKSLAKTFVPVTIQKLKGNFNCPIGVPFALHKRNNANSRFLEKA